ASRQHAGRSVGDFDDLSTYIKNTREISRIILKNKENTVESSLSKEEIQTLSKNFNSESIEDDDYSDSNSSASNSIASSSDVADPKANIKTENRNDRKKETVVKIDTSTDESFSKVSSSDNISSTESDTSEIEEENMT
ncbi:unnamed protein product, partial [Onchocerca ochengi]